MRVNCVGFRTKTADPDKTSSQHQTINTVRQAFKLSGHKKELSSVRTSTACLMMNYISTSKKCTASEEGSMSEIEYGFTSSYLPSNYFRFTNQWRIWLNTTDNPHLELTGIVTGDDFP